MNKEEVEKDLWTKIETLQCVLYIIFAIGNKRMVVI
jgi:hypothetical protein